MEFERYKRQLPLIGEKGQQRLSNSIVCIVGAGALGNIASKFLASAGVRHIFIYDNDIIEEHNLNRQILFNEKSIGKSKAGSLQETIMKINPAIICQGFKFKIDEKSVAILLHGSIVLDCTDDIAITYLLQKYCLEKKIPLVYGKTSGFYGSCGIIKTKPQITQRHINMAKTSHIDNSAYGPTGGIIGSVMANLAIKLILNLSIDENIFYYDSLKNEVMKIKREEK